MGAGVVEVVAKRKVVFVVVEKEPQEPSLRQCWMRVGLIMV